MFKYILLLVSFIVGVSCSIISLAPQQTGKKLFLSRRVVTESEEFDGGVLVNELGKIEGLLKRDFINALNLNNGLDVIDGGELALMAGMVDSHVHVNEPGRTSWEGYVTATRAAAVGGFTTLIDMPLNSVPPTTTLANLKAKAAAAKEEIYVDVGFWGGVVPGNEIELHDLIRAGVVGFKCYLIDSGVSEFPYITPDELKSVFQNLNGTGTVLAFHAELKNSNNSNTTCVGNDCPDPTLYNTYLASRPNEMEVQAVSQVFELLTDNDVHVHIVHVSAADVVPIAEKARSARLAAGHKGWQGGVTAETCAHYLTISSEQIPPGQTQFKCSPPIRNITNKLRLWDYIRDERLDLIASDHSPSTADLKGPDFMKAWGGISSVQFGLSLFWTEASARGYTLSTLSRYMSVGPARLAGLQGRKGALRVGLDADLIYFDPNAAFVVTPEVIQYKNKISPYMYRVLRGKVKQTYLRGQLIQNDGVVFDAPQGNLLLNYECLSRSSRINTRRFPLTKKHKIVNVAVSTQAVLVIMNRVTTSNSDGVTTSNSDRVTTLNSDRVTTSNSDRVTTSNSDGVTTSNSDGVTTSNSDRVTRLNSDRVTTSNSDGVTTSNSDRVTTSSYNNITPEIFFNLKQDSLSGGSTLKIWDSLFIVVVLYKLL